MKKKVLVAFALAASFASGTVLAQTTDFTNTNKNDRKGELYFSWGYNAEWYTLSNIFINQPSLGNNFKMKNVVGHDNPGWTNDFFHKDLTIPQYNYRIGYIFDKKNGWGVEINFDHTKYIIADRQYVHIIGTMNGKPYDGYVQFNQLDKNLPPDSSSFWYLNNGANFLLFNIVKRCHILETKDKKVKLDFLGKAGIGPLIPHVEDKLFDQPKNDPHFQLGGWNFGFEGAVRATFFKYVYLEYTNKLDYARYSGLRIYQGTARQAFGTYEMILNLGVTFPVGKREE
ncbi:MAG: hypothetical protein LBE82_06585 [Chitinophagaceae bacterium]|jgi:opacity protein-like surface antigen|nr:hypothetical protein [Chitinophagaceae bacterium]